MDDSHDLNWIEKITNIFSNVYRYEDSYDFKWVKRADVKLNFFNKHLQNGKHVMKSEELSVGFHRIFDLSELHEKLKIIYPEEEKKGEDVSIIREILIKRESKIEEPGDTPS